MTRVLDEGFLPYLALSTEQRDETTFPSCQPPHNIFTIQVGGRKKEGTSHDRYFVMLLEVLLCSDPRCGRDGAGAAVQHSSLLAKHRDNIPLFVFHSPLFFPDLLALWGCGHCCFRPCIRASACVLLLGAMWDLKVASGQATARVCQAGRPPLSCLRLFRDESYFWPQHITVARDPAKRHIRMR